MEKGFDFLERTAMLIGEEKLQILRNSHIAVFGVGGVGSFAAESLVRAGVGKLTLVDNDTVSKSNINRQLIALNSTLGQFKTEAAARRYSDINSDVNICARNVFVSKENIDSFEFEEFDYVLDCIDTVSAKFLIIEKCVLLNKKIISSMGTGNKLCPEKLKIGDIYKTSGCPLAKVMRSGLRKRGIESLTVLYSTEAPLTPLFQPKDGSKRSTPSSISFVPSVAGLYLAAKAVKDLTGI